MNQSGQPIASGRTLTREELDELDLLRAEIARLATQKDALVFVLGSYDPLKKHRLENVCNAIESTARGDISARLMDEFIPQSDGNLSGHYKFREIAMQADAIVGVVEDDQGGFTYEQGIIVERPDYFSKTYVLKKKYAPIIEKRKYSWMQSTSLFTELEYADRIYEWHGDREFATKRDELISDLQHHLR